MSRSDRVRMSWSQQHYERCRAELLHAVEQLEQAVRRDPENASAQKRLRTLQEMCSTRSGLEVDQNGRRRVAEQQRQFLSFDVNGRGRAVEVIGDLATADRIVVYVPGMGQSLESLCDVSVRARRALDECGPGTAMIAWHNYQFPFRVGGLSRGPAERGAADLKEFVGDLQARFGGAEITAIGNSYGSVVVGEALRQGMRPDKTMLVGSPGVHPSVRSAADLGMDQTTLFTARSRVDWICRTRWFGPDPSSFPDATRVQTTGLGHQAYWQPNSELVKNLGRIVRGELESLTVVDAAEGARERALGPLVSAAGARLGPVVSAARDQAAKLPAKLPSQLPAKLAPRLPGRTRPYGLPTAGADGSAL